MSIVLSYDFSDASEAAPAAAALAALFKQPLLLAHIVDPTLRGLVPQWETNLDSAIQRRLEEVADGLGAAHPGLQVKAVQLKGEPAETLNTLAAREQAELLILASPGHSEARHGVRSVSETVAHSANRPVLVIRNPQPWLDWAAGRRRLRAVLGMSQDSPFERAVELTARFRMAGPCDVIASEVYRRREMERNYGLPPPRHQSEPDPQLGLLLARGLRKRISGLRGSGEVRIDLHQAAGLAADHLLQLAERERADVIVLGRRLPADQGRAATESDVVLHRSRISTLISPEPAQQIASGPPPRIRRLLAATDLSRFGNQSVRHALGLLQGEDGELHLFHVADAQATTLDGETSISATLRRLVPEGCPFRVSTEVVFESEPAAAIAAAAERIDADAICVASHARGGVRRLALGSVTDELLRKTRRPVLVVRPVEA